MPASDRFYRAVLAMFCTASLGAGSLSLGAGTLGAAEDAIDFNRQIRPLLWENCLTCHGPDEQERAAGLRLDTSSGAHEDRGGYAAVVPGDPEASELIARLTSDDPDLRMPPPGKGKPRNADQIDQLRRWIEQGGDYDQHWAYQTPARPALPQIDFQAWLDPVHSSQRWQWPGNPIDHFVARRLQAEGWLPSPPADRWTLARRVAIDLTGLPPSWAEAQRFVDDKRANAYEIYVDSLLAKPSFGEHWARGWLDLARYADSAGYADDPQRTIWAFRDYVIQSFNQNKPLDQFTIEQIAGDLLDDSSEEQLVATAFHRNTMTNNEGGTNDEEFRNVAVVDRVNTTFAVWMGTTMACAQCHTHKYDPITHNEYFQIFDIFNQTQDADRRDESPLLQRWTKAQRGRRDELKSLSQTRQQELEQQ